MYGIHKQTSNHWRKHYLACVCVCVHHIYWQTPSIVIQSTRFRGGYFRVYGRISACCILHRPANRTTTTEPAITGVEDSFKIKDNTVRRLYLERTVPTHKRRASKHNAESLERAVKVFLKSSGEKINKQNGCQETHQDSNHTVSDQTILSRRNFSIRTFVWMKDGGFKPNPFAAPYFMRMIGTEYQVLRRIQYLRVEGTKGDLCTCSGS